MSEAKENEPQLDNDSGCDCQAFMAKVEELLDCELEDAQAQILHEHARICPSCANAETAEMHLRSLIRDCMSDPNVYAPKDLRARILISIHRETVTRMRVKPEQ